MLFIEICVGSSCHLKGAPRIVEMMQKKIEENALKDEIILSGSFCTGKCNRVGVTISLGSEVYTGITAENFSDFWANTVMPAVEKNKGK